MMRKSNNIKKTIAFVMITSFVSIFVVFILLTFTVANVSFSRSTNDALRESTLELSKQIVYNYENFFDNIIDTSSIVQRQCNTVDVSKNREEISQYLLQTILFRAHTNSIEIYDYVSRRCISSSDSETLGTFATNKEEWFDKAVNNSTIHFFSRPYEKGKEVVINVSKLIDYNNGASKAILKLEISFSGLLDLDNKSNYGEGGHVTLIDNDDQIIYSTLEEDVSAQEYEIITSTLLGSTQTTLGANRFWVNIDTLAGTQWRISIFINTDEIYRIEANFILTMGLISIGVLIVAISLFMYITKKVSDPLKRLESVMKDVEKADYFKMQSLELVGPLEVERLYKRFNKMMKKIQELMTRIVEEQKAQRTSELKALQNQINPHFLYNTLDSITWLIENNKNKEAGGLVVALAKLFRIGLSKGRAIITVREELEHVKNYLLIQSVRYQGAFEYEIEAEEEVLELKTMKLILQPLVENSIYHGLRNRIDEGHIKITVRKENDKIVFEIKDNGYGIKEEKIKEIYDSFDSLTPQEGVGLKNVFQRVNLFYGKDAEMQVLSELDEGTTIIIKEPTQWEKDF